MTAEEIARGVEFTLDQRRRTTAGALRSQRVRRAISALAAAPRPPYDYGDLPELIARLSG